MYENGKIYMGLAGDKRVELALNMCNRHGLIAGASGTGKTVTMKVMAESFSDAGVPVFLCDVKGDVAGICAPGQSSEGMEKRIDKFGLRDRFVYQGYPTTFWDVYQEGGHAVRATVSDMGPELLSRILGLTAVQEGILHIVFQIADDKGLLLIDLKDLRAMLTYVNEHRTEYMMTYGNITSQSVAAILRALLPLEQQGGELFFGEPALDIRDWMRTAADGRGMINVLDCVKLVQNPTLYASFLLWMLSELFEILPEAGDLDKPRMVFFFDEAHMLFRDAPTVLLQKVEQTVKLIRSRGVGVYFVTQSPSDIPDTVLAQLSNRVQHALRAYTPTELKAVRAAARAFRPNPAFQAEDAIMGAGRGRGADLVLGRSGRTRYGGAHEDYLPPEPHVSAGAHGPGQGDDARRYGEVRWICG
ncbi:helicase HerA-like domain-containing protein [Dysosmobacter sp.]|uniref:helicase HerA-like domain-containing protein n=1 Tax=Dysosmobacter sp. TaxID=2591382 RepID=UPI003AB324BC